MKKIFLFVFGCCIASASISQNEFPYTLSVETREYLPLDQPTLITTEPGWDTLDFTVHIPFDFYYMGSHVDSMTVVNYGADFLMSNGHLFLPYHTFIRDRSITDSTEISYINYQISQGDSGQILTLEYENIGFCDNIFIVSTVAYGASFQIKFYENLNKIEICFGHSDYTSPIFMGCVGLPIAFASSVSQNDPLTFDTAYYLTGSIFDPEIMTGDSTTLDIVLGGPPPAIFMIDAIGNDMEGLVYSFAPVENPSTSITAAKGQTFLLYPNPASEFLQIRRSVSSREIISVYNFQGTKVMENSIDGDLSNLDISALPAGFYFLTSDGKGRGFVKL